MKHNTLRIRFALWTALLILFVLLIFGVYVYFSMAHSLQNALDETLRVTASQIIASLNVENGTLTIPDSLSEPPEGETLPAGFSVRVLTSDGHVLEQTGVYMLKMPSINLPINSAYYTTLNKPPLRSYTAPVLDNNQLIAIVQVVQSTNEVQYTLNRLLTILLIASPLLVLAAAASGYFLAANALIPIEAITKMAQHISAEDLSARLNLNTDDELGRLASTFDKMLDRLEDSFFRERQFTADASHELRTPLTAMQAILGVTRQRKRNVDEYEQALDDLTEETERLRNLTESLLALAHTDLPSHKLDETIDLSLLLEDVTESMRILAETKGLELVCEITPHLAIPGNRDDLIRLFVNLIDNAIKYTSHGSVTISTLKKGKQVCIKVKDTGIGIPERHIPHIFDRFYRVEQSRNQYGAGLGLSLVQQILTIHRGVIKVESTLGKGTTIYIQLPAL